MNSRAKLLVAAIATTWVGFGTTVHAGPLIGFDPTGTGTNYRYADLWTDLTDSGTDVKITGSGGPTVFAPGDIHDFHTQLRVGTLQNNGSPVIISGMNDPTAANGFELTKTIAFTDVVTAFQPTPAAVNFGFTGQTISPNLTIYFDNITDGSRAIPGDGGGTVACYGNGFNCGANDGIAILTAHLIDVTSSFSGTPTLGTGSFDIRFAIDSVNANYLDISNLPINGGTGLPIFDMKITGTLNLPSQFTPDAMWDGTSTTGPNATLFKIDSSETFIGVPEPSSLALLGLGLLSAGFVRRKHKGNG
jgi:hypothetical protein